MDHLPMPAGCQDICPWVCLLTFHDGEQMKEKKSNTPLIIDAHIDNELPETNERGDSGEQGEGGNRCGLYGVWDDNDAVWCIFLRATAAVHLSSSTLLSWTAARQRLLPSLLTNVLSPLSEFPRSIHFRHVLHCFCLLPPQILLDLLVRCPYWASEPVISLLESIWKSCTSSK